MNAALINTIISSVYKLRIRSCCDLQKFFTTICYVCQEFFGLPLGIRFKLVDNRIIADDLDKLIKNAKLSDDNQIVPFLAKLKSDFEDPIVFETIYNICIADILIKSDGVYPIPVTVNIFERLTGITNGFDVFNNRNLFINQCNIIKNEIYGCTCKERRCK